MPLARTLRNDREKMGEHPMYRPSRGPGQLQTQSQPGADQYRVRRGEDPLAELARLIGQEDPFAEFNGQQPRRVAPKANVISRPATPEPRAASGANGNGAVHANGQGRPLPTAQVRTPQVPPRQHAAARIQAAPVPARTPAPSIASERAAPLQQAPRPARPMQPQQAPQPQPQRPQFRSNTAEPAAYRDAPRPAQPSRQNGHDANARYAEQNYRREDFSETERARPGRQPVREARTPNERDRYVPEEALRHSRMRPQPAAYREPKYDTYEDDFDPEYADDAYLSDHADDVYDDVRRSGRGIGFWIVSGIVVASLIAVAFLGVFAYRTVFNTPQRAAVITKSNAPTKVEQQPAQTNAVAPNKAIQDRIAGAAETQTLKREEQPIDLTTQRPTQFSPPQQQQAPQNNFPAAAPQQQQPVDTGPRKVKTITVRSDGTTAPQSNAPLPLQANPPVQQQEPPAAAPQRPQSNLPPQHRNVASLNPTTPPATTSGNYVVQVASHKTPQEAQAAWQQLKSQYGSIFGARNADIRKVDLGDRGTFYRAMVGPMNRDQANALCQNLKTQGAGCIVQTRN